MAVLTLQSKGTTGGDAYIDSSLPNDNFGSTGLIRVGINGTTVDRGLVRFDLSALPANAVVSSAVLSLFTVGEDFTADRGIAVTRALTQWYEGIKDQAVPAEAGSTWSKRNYFSGVNWGASTPGGQAGVDYVTPFSGGSVTITSTGITFNWTVTSDVQLWANGTLNYGFWLLANTPADTDSRKIFANFETGAANAPKLVITYTSNIAVTPTARFAVGSRFGPSAVIKGSITTAPTARFSVGATVLSPVMAGYTLSPAPADAIAQTVIDSVFKNSVALSPAALTTVGATLAPTTLKNSVVLTPVPAFAVGEQGGLASLVDLTLRPAAATAKGSTLGSPKAIRVWAEICDPRPLLYITDGTIRENGQADLLNLISRMNGFILDNWNPIVTQYKNGGTFSNSALSNGRRLVRRSFDNAIEVMELKVQGHNQNNAIKFSRDFFGWQELAADYWTTDWAQRPVYLVAKAAKEQEIRYAMIHMMSCPGLTNPYAQPFYSKDGTSLIDSVTLRIERGDWKDAPPGEGRCVQLSSIRAWTIQGWTASNTSAGGGDTITGNVTALIQAKNGDILAGASGTARIYRSIDDGKTWSFLTKFSGTIASTDNINAFTKDSSGNLYAAVTGNSVAQGIWKSINNGVSWTKVKSHPLNTGYLDITAAQGTKITAVGKATSSTDSPVIYSTNAGVTWTNVSTPYYNQEHMSVAAYQEPVLFSQYPTETYGSVSTFIGTNSYYTAQYGVGQTGSNPPQLYGFGTIGGGAGNGGLDMVSFLVRDAQGRYLRRALWGVKSAADVTDTEIWQWPSGTYQSGSTQFSKFTTIDNVLFNVMYVDPTPDINAIARTIWAGANGEIWVSYNSGLTWAVATTAPVNQIRSILRTTAGTLIAGGDNAEIFIYTGTGSQGGGVGSSQDKAIYGGGVVVNTYPLGREETCDDEVYASNKSVFSNITHVLHYNGSTYSELQFSTQPPYALLGTNPTVNKAVYFGSKTNDSNVAGSVFSGVVFNISQVAEDITIVWEYWNGTAWVSLTVQDNSNGFRILGSSSTHWVVPATWATTAVNGVTGYWVRARISALGPVPVYPIHSKRYIYTPNLPYVEIAEGEIDGDMPADGQIRWRNRGDDPLTVIDMEVDRVICGLRSVTRGEFFNAYINISDVQIPYGMTITKHVDAVWGVSQRAPTNRALTVSHASGVELNRWNDLVTFSIANTIARDYYGTYHAFVRVYKSGTGTNNWQVRLRTSFGSGGSTKDTKASFPTLAGEWEALDLGEISIPTTQIARLGSNLGDLLKLTVQGYCTATATALIFYDLILIPTDEWAVDSISPLPAISDVAKVKGGSVLDIDSITNPKASLTATNKTSGDLIVARYQAINNGPVILQKGVRQRLWFLVMSYENFWRSAPEITGSVQAFKQQRYFAYRGVD